MTLEPDVITEDPPYGAFVAVRASEGERVFYIDLNLEIRWYVMGKDRWFPRFIVPDVDSPMLAFLKDALRRECPGGEIHHIRVPHENGFFLYTRERGPR